MILYNRAGVETTPNLMMNGKPVRKGTSVCGRCGGLGGSERWQHTGWTCFRCGGDGIDPNPLYEKLYTAEKLESLNAIKAKADARRAAKKAEALRLEMIRREEHRLEIVSEWGDFAERIKAELQHGESEILDSVYERIMEMSKEPSEKQIEVVNRIIDQRSAERKRLEKAAHVGTIKERRDFTLTLIYFSAVHYDTYPQYWSYWSLFLDEDGSKVACKSAPHVIGIVADKDGEYTKGQIVKVKATIVEHTINKKTGEPITYINRPKPI